MYLVIRQHVPIAKLLVYKKYYSNFWFISALLPKFYYSFYYNIKYEI